jgi:hypothetical protein
VTIKNAQARITQSTIVSTTYAKLYKQQYKAFPSCNPISPNLSPTNSNTINNAVLSIPKLSVFRFGYCLRRVATDRW